MSKKAKLYSMTFYEKNDVHLFTTEQAKELCFFFLFGIEIKTILFSCPSTSSTFST